MSYAEVHASDKQINFIRGLMGEREVTEEQRKKAEEQIEVGLDMEQASKWITRLKELPKKTTGGKNGLNGSLAKEPKAGMYKTVDGTILRVYLGQQSGRMLVKKLVGAGDDWGYEYVGAAAYRLPADATPLPLEEAKKFGKMTGTCCVCARRLDVPESVEAGIGPVCSKKFAVAS